MRRYRKGQIFKPPTAGEHAAIADAAEAHRRSPAQPQDYRPGGQTIEVKTPTGGIAARNGATFYWEWCKRCVHVASGDDRSRVDTDEPLIVYNLLYEAIPGDSYQLTGLTDTGIRYVQLASRTLVELCLAEDHKGQGVPFNAYLGVWDPSTDDWDYDNCSITVKAIDHRYDVPQPDAGATGLFVPRLSDEHGVIFECVSLDCSSEGACCP